MKIQIEDITLDTRIVTRMKVYEAYRRIVFSYNMTESEMQRKVEIQINDPEEFDKAIESIEEALAETGTAIDTLVILAPSVVYSPFEYYRYIDEAIKVVPADIDIEFRTEYTDEE